MKKILFGMALVVAIGLVIGGVYAYGVLTAGVPRHQGAVSVAGIERPVTVFFDEYEIPHVYADSLDDIAYTMGYLHASERLFQMDLGRRQASGRLSELFGKRLLDIDRFRRVIGLHRVAVEVYERLEPALKRQLQHYTDGVNDYATTHPLPLEYTLAGIEFAPWEPTDSIVMGLDMGWILSGNWSREITRWLLVQERGEDIAYQLMPRHTDGGPYIIPPSVRQYTPLPTRSSAFLPSSSHDRDLTPDLTPLTPGTRQALAHLVAWDRAMRGLGEASNSWVVSGKHTESGKPLLANDPHLEMMLPSIWYEAHLVAPDVDVIGVMFPGSPLPVLGHSRSIAWGATTTMADTQDVYIERPNPANPDEYEYDGAYEPFRKIPEIIRYKDGDTIAETTFTVRLSRHGPIINDIREDLQAKNAPPMAFRWTLYEYPPDLSALLDMAGATTWEDFLAGLQKLTAPVQNWVYADVNGNIGYIAAGAFPIRAPGHDGTLPAPGWDSRYEWRGLIPQADVPQAYNPERGFIVTANNKVVPEDDYPYHVSYHYAAPYRAQRITELLTEAIERGAVTPEDMQRIQNDVTMLEAKRLIPLFIKSARNQQIDSDPRVARALKFLDDWDTVADTENVGATLFHQIRLEAIQLILQDEMSESLYEGYKHWESNTFDNILAGPSPLYDDRRTPERVETRDEILAEAVKRALATLTERLGDDMTQWRWGRVHTLTFVHPIARAVPQLGRFLNVGPFPHRGGRHTVNNASWYDTPFIAVSGPSMRHVVDMDDVGDARITNTLGQSGHRMSPHYADQVEMWRAGEYHAMPMGRDSVERAAVRQMVLVPQ